MWPVEVTSQLAYHVKSSQPLITEQLCPQKTYKNPCVCVCACSHALHNADVYRKNTVEVKLREAEIKTLMEIPL